MRLRIALGAVLLVLMPAYVSGLRAEDDKVAQILDRCSAGLLQIKSLQCDWSIVGTEEMTETAAASRGAYAARHFLQENKFRIEYYQNLASPAGKPDSIQAYDGAKLFYYLKATDGLNFQTKATFDGPYPGPLDCAYQWIYAPGQPNTWAELQKKETWQKAEERAKYIGPAKQDGVSFEIVEFSTPYPKHPHIKRRVFFQIDLDYFPRKHDRLDGETTNASTHVVEHAKVKLGDQTLIIPTEVSHREFGPLVKKAVREYYLDKDSLKLNTELDEKLFRISSEGISYVRDNDLFLPK